MKSLLVVLLALTFVASTNIVFGENTFFDSVKFIQYLDENTALEEVRNGNIDMYYYRISSDRLENPGDREGLQVFDSTGGSYSLLINPAKSDRFNPFSEKDARFALNYLVDRKLIVNELMGGYGIPRVSYYSLSDPDYLTIIEQVEQFNFRYNPSLAEEIISKSLETRGAIKQDGQWTINGEPIKISIFIRSDDPVRKSIGEILSSELQKIGFEVKKEFGDLNKAFVIVYGSNPAELKWNLYTEGWARSAFVRYDSVGLGQMYSPWFSNMPGFNDPTYWNYENNYIDSLTQKIYTGDFESKEQRNKLIQQAVKEGITESVRIFLASKVDQYVVNEKINGVVNDFGAGVPSRFTPINANSDKEELVIGVKQIYQGAWNPVMGLSDSYSRHIWGIISDPATFKHPFSGKTFPIRANWIVDTAGPHDKLDLPNEAIIWDPKSKAWKQVESGTQATSKVTFDFEFNNWHNGKKIDMMDILHSLYFTIEWGTQSDETDKTFDTEFTPRAAQSVQTIIGINPIDKDTIEVYVNYWHFDDGEIADWAALWSLVPWEISVAMEQAVIDGKVSFSRSGATSKNVNWLSLIIPKDASLVKEYLIKFKEKSHIPSALEIFEKNPEYYESRYESSIDWIENNNHAVISNGPFFLESYSPESRTITVNSFDDETYPFSIGHWSEFESTKIPKITKAQIPDIVNKESEFEINIQTLQADSILYFLSNSNGEIISSDSIEVKSDIAKIIFPNNIIEKLDIGTNNLKVFAISEKVLKPDYYEKSFLVTEKDEILPDTKFDELQFDTYSMTEFTWIIILAILIILSIIIVKKKMTLNKIHNP